MRFLGWLFIILCAEALSSLAISTTMDRAIVFSTHIMTEQEVNGINGTTILHGERGGRGYELKQAEDYSIKRQKGEGTYGGANLAHHPRPSEKSAALLPKRSAFSTLPNTILSAGFSLVLLFPT